MISRTVDLGGPVHYADHGGSGEPMVLVHGLGGSYVNWMSVAPRLSERYRVVAPDLAGFGLTPPAGRPVTIEGNRVLLDRFLDATVGAPAILVGNSMGGLISLLEAAARPERVRALVLLDAALQRPFAAGVDPRLVATFLALATPGVGERVIRARTRRLGPTGLVRETLRLCAADPLRIPGDVVAAHLDLAAERERTALWGPAAFLEAARSLIGVMLRHRRVLAACDRVTAPTLVVHGDRDRLVPLAAATAVVTRRPDWTLRVLSGVGHIPQLEVPDGFVDTVVGWLDTLPTGEVAASAG